MKQSSPEKIKDESAPFSFNRQKLAQLFFFASFAIIFYQLFLLAKPFFTALLLAAMLALATFPLYIPMRRWLRNANLAAFLLTLGVFLAAVIPLIAIGWFLVNEADRLLPTAQAFFTNFQNTDLMSLKDKLPALLQPALEPLLHFFQRVDFQPQEKILKYAGDIGGDITAFGAAAASHAVLTLVNIMVFLISLFFAFRDGESLYRWALSLIPMAEEDKRALAKRAYETFLAVLLGVIITAGAQGLVAMIGFWIAGVRLPVLLGFAVVIVAFFGASFVVTLPAALLMFHESVGWGIFLLVWGVGVVGFLDNVLKPIFIGSRARMPFVIIFFSIIGGIQAYGLLGFVLGPVIVASFLTFVSIYRKSYDMRNSDEDLPIT